ncbi:oxygenase MpaB family protein [Nocardioides jejuensis]|nr:oxygenase MpaB family protein [Nocardioides jejuensis]
MTTSEITTDLSTRVEALVELARQPAAEVYVPVDDVDVEAWTLVGDPLCEALLLLMRERKLMGGDIYSNARALEAAGVAEAVAFFQDVEAVPSWLDFDSLRAGASMARRNPVGLMFAIHGCLPMTYLDPATAHVMGSTGRLAKGGDFKRRYWETATGFVGALDVVGMMPGGERWIEWVRIRFLHTMIRLGIQRSGQWPLPEAMPIGQVATAASTHVFGPFRVNIIKYFGGIVSQEELESFCLMWRWISRIEGANNQLLGRTHEEQQRLQERLVNFNYGSSDAAERMTRDVVTGAATMRFPFLMPKRMHRAVIRNLLAPDLVEIFESDDLPGDLGIPRDLPAEVAVRTVGLVLAVLNQGTRLTLVRSAADRWGLQFLEMVVRRQLGGVAAQYRGAPVGGRPTDQ